MNASRNIHEVNISEYEVAKCCLFNLITLEWSSFVIIYEMIIIDIIYSYKSPFPLKSLAAIMQKCNSIWKKKKIK